MITFDNIKTKKGLFPDGRWTVMAAISFCGEKSVNNDDFEGNPSILENAALEAKNLVWKGIYGDLFDPIKELEQHTIRNCDAGEEEAVQKLCDKINQLLRLP